MHHVSRVAQYVLLVAIIIYVVLYVVAPPLPEKSEIIPSILNSDPKQYEITVDPIEKKFDKITYTINPMYTYAFDGLIVTQHDTKGFTDVSHDNDPANTKDICIVWGENITNGAYKKVSYESGDFTCFVKWNQQIDPPFVLNRLANNHIIPANMEVAETIKKMRIGDQIHIEGKLATYTVKDTSGNTLGTRGTSTTRDDTGNGACEVVYVEKAHIIKRGAGAYYAAKEIALWTGVGAICLLFAFSFVPEKS